MDALLKTVDLKKYFSTNGGTLHAVDGVNISVAPGETLGVVGESGCGKSTLGSTIMRLTEPTSGQIIYNGKDITHCSRREMKHIRQEMQMIFQDPYSSLNGRMTVQELIAEPIIINKLCSNRREVYERVAGLMDMVGLDQRLAFSYPHELDGGRRQRIGVARALAMKPKLIVCDEPVSALDVSIQAQILNLLMDLQDNMKLAYLFISHDLGVVKHISDNVCVMYLGRQVELAPTAELFANPLHPYTRVLLSSIPVPNLDGRGRRREIIHGEVTSPIDPPDACRFCSRCPNAMNICRESEPELREAGHGHLVACHLYDRKGQADE